VLIPKGVLWTGGSFTDVPDFDPIISRVITDSRYIAAEPVYDLDYWFPVGLASINRFLSTNGTSNDRLVLIPGQYKPDNASTGKQRLFDSMDVEIFYAPFDNLDFQAPNIWQNRNWRDASNSAMVNFQVLVTDSSSNIDRVVVLYRQADSTDWQQLDLVYDPVSEMADGRVQIPAGFQYVVQAVDASGNVAMALDHGSNYGDGTEYLYLPTILKQ
jgi:hypothetical protein